MTASKTEAFPGVKYFNYDIIESLAYKLHTVKNIVID
jgi:hypothetical protein